MSQESRQSVSQESVSQQGAAPLAASHLDAPRPASARAGAPNPNHHLWKNGSRWWVAFTVLVDGWRQERLRLSLGTADIDEARRRRDALFVSVARTPGVQLSIRPQLEELSV